ncbi:MAG: radical SAM family heme chaperone HemW [Actinomycetota bacterium]|nr:radical SAM family heme chaperone HemW [Actinomycetota bacterium]
MKGPGSDGRNAPPAGARHPSGGEARGRAGSAGGPVAGAAGGGPPGAGVYVHIPFCARRCGYCAFATWDDRSQLADDYVAAVRREVAAAVGSGLAPAATVFFGGGTPSRLTARQLSSILELVLRAPGAEVTAECNPEDAGAALLHAWREAGVNRVSLGVQSMVPSVLASLGRYHSGGAVEGAVEALAGAGLGDSYSVDLIFGAVGESMGDWERTLLAVLGLDPPPAHVSAYGLIAEPGTPLGSDPTRHPDPDDQAAKYELADEVLESAGYSWYEISNWSRPGAACRHNQLYWSQGEYRGFGCAAHSHELLADGRARRWWNVRTPERYLRSVLRGESPVGGGELLDPATRAAERIGLALRTVRGVDLADLPGGDELALLGELGLVELVEAAEVAAAPGDPAAGPLGGSQRSRVRLTRRGRLLASEVTLRLLGT